MHLVTLGMKRVWAVGGLTRLALLVGTFAALQGIAVADDEPGPEAPAAPAKPADPSAPPKPEIPADVPTADLPTAEQLDNLGKRAEENAGFQKWVQKVTSNFTVQFEELSDKLDSHSAKSFAVCPKAGLVFTKAVFSQFAAIRSRNAAAADELALIAKIAAILLDRRTNPTTEAERGAGFGHLAYEAARVFQGQPADVVALRWGAYLLRRNDAKGPVSTREWRNLLTAVGGGTGIPGNEAAVTWASDELAALVKANPADAALAQAFVILDLERGISVTPVKPTAGGPLLQKSLAVLLAPEAIPSDDKALVARYNRGVTVARLYGVVTKAEYRAKLEKSENFLLTCELPLECGWKVTHSDGDQNEWSIVREGRSTGEVSLEVWKYRADTNYTNEEGKVVGGDNLHGNLKRHFDRWKSELEKVRKGVQVVPRLSKYMPNPKGFEIVGIDAGAEIRVREWYFRAETNKMYVYNVRLVQKGGITEKDPEVAAVLESIQERPEAKK